MQIESKESPQATNQQTQPSSAEAGGKVLKRGFGWACVKFILASLVMLVLGLTWIFQTASGTRFVFGLVERLGLVSLQFQQVDGRLADRLQIAEVRFKNQTEVIVISGLELEWRPWSLWRGVLDISKVQASQVKVSSKPSSTPTHAPTDLHLPFDVNIEQAALGQLHLSDWLADGSEHRYFSLRAMTASAKAGNARYHVQATAISDWGHLQAQGSLSMQSPFAIDLTGQYKGQAHPDIPEVKADLQFDGNLLDLNARAQLVQTFKDTTALESSPAVKSKADEKLGARGHVQFKLKPFAEHSIRLAKVSVQGLDLTHLNPHAPTALLNVHADLESQSINSTEPAPLPNKNKAVSVLLKEGLQSPTKMSASEQAKKSNNNSDKSANTNANHIASPEPYFLKGRVVVENAKPQSFDKHGIPFKAAKALIEWRHDSISMQDLSLQMQSGEFNGKAGLEIHAHAQPALDAQLHAENIDLLQFDSRLRKTQIKGDLQIQTKRTRFIDFQLQASDARNRLDGRASFEFNAAGNNGSLHIEKVDLQADQSRFTGRGDMSFEGAKKFDLQGNLFQFDPSIWSKLPAGRIDTELKLSGTLTPKTALQVQLSQLNGEWNGHRLMGLAKFAWAEDQSLAIEQAELNWGKNSLTAAGMLGKAGDELRWQARAHDLQLFSVFLGIPIAGKLEAEGKFSGGFDALSMQTDAKLENASVRQWRLGSGEFHLRSEPGRLGAVQLDLLAKDFYSTSIDLNASSSEGQVVEKRRGWAEELRFQVSGQRQNHQFQLQTRFDRSHKTELRGEGDLDLSSWRDAMWKGRFAQFKLMGFAGNGSRQETNDLQLDAPMAVELSRERVALDGGRFSGVIGKLKLDQFEWTPSSMQTRGSLDELRVMEVANLWKPQHFIAGDLRLGAAWDVQLKGSAKGKFELQRQAGDLYLNDADGTGQPMYMGLNELRFAVVAGGLIAGTDAEKVSMQFNANGKRLGQWQAKLETELRQRDEKWILDSEAPVSGALSASLPELQWLAAQLSAEFGLKGSLNVDARIAGKMGKPTYRASVEGNGLELAVASEGLLFPNGVLRAELTEKNIKLQQLRFSNKINFIPKLEQTRDLNWMGQEGEFTASGEINWLDNSGAIGMQWKQFPVLQRKDRWLVMSGDAKITQTDRLWSLIGKLGADGAYFRLPKLPPPSLSNDVVLNQNLKLDPETSELDERKSFRTRVDLQIDMGPRFVFVGRGLNTALTGTMRLRMNDNSTWQASGSIATNGGQYEGYGQQLEIERGILKFQGPPNNPSLNVRALRKGLLVEAGVEVTGNVANPQVRLVSEPNVPDNDKISWLILGREADQLGVNDASLLLTAAGALFGTDGSGNIPKELAKGLGFDEFSIGPAENGGSSKLPSQTIAGETTVGAVNNDSVLNIGWRLKPGLVVSIERGMADASSALKASWQLGRRVRLVARSGTDVSLDVKYSFSFN